MQFTPEVIEECQRVMRIVASLYRSQWVEQDDLISCAWLRVCMRIEEFDAARASFATFVSRQARYAMQDYLRALAPGSRPNKKDARYVSLDGLTTADHGREIENRVDVYLLLLKTRVLTVQERSVLHLRFDEERRLEEIGDSLGMIESRVCQVMDSALKKMRAVAA